MILFYPLSSHTLKLLTNHIENLTQKIVICRKRKASVLLVKIEDTVTLKVFDSLAYN